MLDSSAIYHESSWTLLKSMQGHARHDINLALDSTWCTIINWYHQVATQFSDRKLFTEIEEEHSLCPLGNVSLQTIKNVLTKLEFHRLWMKTVRSWMIKLSPHKQLWVELIHHLKEQIMKCLDRCCPELSAMMELFYKSVLSWCG